MSGFSPVQQDMSGKFGCPVLSGQETHTYAQSGRAIVLCTTDQAAPDQMTIPLNKLSCF